MAHDPHALIEHGLPVCSAGDLFEWLQVLASDERLGHFTVRVGLTLSAFVDRNGGYCWPSQQTLAKRAGATVRGVRKAIEELSVAGHLEVIEQRGRTHTNRYRPILQKRNDGSAFEPAKGNGSSAFDLEKGNDSSSFRDDNRNGDSAIQSVKPEPLFQKTGTVVPPELVYERLEEEAVARGTEFSLEDGDRLFARLSESVIPDGHPLLADPLGGSVCAGWLRSGFHEVSDIGPAIRKAFTKGQFKIKRMASMTSWVSAHHAERLKAEAVQPAIDTMNPAPPLKRRTHNEPGFVHVGGDMLVGDFAALDRR